MRAILRGVVLGLVLAQGACVQRWERAYSGARIAAGPAGINRASPGDRMVFERWRFVHYPLPFVVGGENFSWEVDQSRVREGAVLRLPDPAVRAEYQRFGHPARPGKRDVRGTITFVRVSPRELVADLDVASDSAEWKMTKRVRYERRPVPPER
jgi:hypothetical protein